MNSKTRLARALIAVALSLALGFIYDLSQIVFGFDVVI